jgi:hypothetical protein
VRESDVRWFDENLTEDFVNSNPDCSLVDRAGFLAQIARPSAVKNIQCEDVRIQMLGEVAIIRARTTYVKPDGQPGRGGTRMCGRARRGPLALRRRQREPRLVPATA